jgi:hypothetical protein
MRIRTQVDQGFCCNFVVERNRNEEGGSSKMVSPVDQACIIAVLSSTWYLFDGLPIDDKKGVYDLHLVSHVVITIVQLFIGLRRLGTSFNLTLRIFKRDHWFLSRFALNKNCCDNFIGIVNCRIVHTGPTPNVRQLEPSL